MKLKLYNIVWEFSFVILFFYVFFIQYAVISINNALIILCGFSILIGLLKINSKIRIFDNMLWLCLFVFTSFIASYFISIDRSRSLSYGIRLIEYILTSLSLYLFLIMNPTRLKYIYFYIWLPLTLLILYVFFYGTQINSIGSIGIENINANSISSYILILFFTSYILLEYCYKKWHVVIILSILAISFFVQIKSASRRGFIVIVFFILSNFIWNYSSRFIKKITKKKIFIYYLYLSIIPIVLYFLVNYITKDTLLGERLLGFYNGGDVARLIYQKMAFEKFIESPVFGIGLNSVFYYAGNYSHSLYFEVISCTGIIGSVLLSYSFLLLFVRLFYYSRYKNFDLRRLNKSRIFYIFLVSLLISGIAVVMIYDFYFYIIIALLSASVIKSKEYN